MSNFAGMFTNAIAMTPVGVFFTRLWRSLSTAWPSTRRTTLWLLKIMTPVSLAVCLMQYFGVIEWIAGYTAPLFRHLGLPGDAAIPFVSGALTGTYGGIASMMVLPMTLREATIVALMICLCHGLPMESSVVRKTGSSFWGMSALRVFMAIGCAWLLDWFLPPMEAPFALSSAHAATAATLGDTLWAWCLDMAKMAVVVLAIVYGLMIIQRMLEAYDGIRRISRSLGPVMKVFGIPSKTAYLWLVGNVLGISYGSAVMLELQDKGVITKHDANDANYHLVMNHSMLEDTIVFAALGVSAWLVVGVRMGAALAVVWTRRALQAVGRRRLTPRA